MNGQWIVKLKCVEWKGDSSARKSHLLCQVGADCSSLFNRPSWWVCHPLQFMSSPLHWLNLSVLSPSQIISFVILQSSRISEQIIINRKKWPTLRYNIANVRLGEHDLSKEKVSLYTKFIHPCAKFYAWLEIHACSRLNPVSLCVCYRIWSRTKTLFYESRWSSILKIGNKKLRRIVSEENVQSRFRTLALQR